MGTIRDLDDLSALSEDELRLNVLIPLLVATEGLCGITDVHGRNEKGLDLVFFEDGSIERLCYGLQLKACDVRGGGTQSGTVKEIVDQLQIARDLSHPVLLPEVGRVQIDRFIVATSGKISDTAREEIASRMGKLTVTFWDGAEILRRVRQRVPEILAAGDGISVAYLKQLLARFDTLGALDGVPGVAQRTLTSVYEEPSLARRFDPGLAGREGTRRPPRTRFPALELADLGVNSVVIAEQDGGKSALLRMIAMRRAREILEGRAPEGRGQLPILLHAKRILDAGLAVAGALQEELRRFGAGQLSAKLEKDLAAGTYVVLVDGFSELLKEEEKEDCAHAVSEFVATFPESKVVVTARPVDFLTPQYFQDFTHFVIEEFNQSQVASLLSRWTRDTPALADVARKIVRRVREALQLPGCPISATIGVMVYETQGRYITNIAEAVDRYMVIRLGRYAYELGISQQVDYTRKQHLLSSVAYRMVDEELDSLPIAEVVEAFDAGFERLGEERRGEVVLQELVDGGVLCNDAGRIVFYRSAFRDFFAAHALNQMRQRDGTFGERFVERKWGLVLVFAAGLHPENSALLAGLTERVERLKKDAIGPLTQDYFYAAFLLGRILSNSELTDKTERLRVLRACLAASVDSVPEFAAAARQQFGAIGDVAALIGVEFAFFATVGVPWLENQFRALLQDPDLADEARYLVGSVYANLGCAKCFEFLDEALAKTESARVMLALEALLFQIGAERRLSPSEKKAYHRLLQRVHRRLAKPGRRAEVKRLLRVKSKLLELEVKRMKRLEGAR